MSAFKLVQVCRACLCASAFFGSVGSPVFAQATAWPPAPPVPTSQDVAPGDLPPSIAAAAAGPGTWRCTFTYDGAEDLQDVSIAGTFNNWNRAALPCRSTAGRRWTATVELPSGVHEYKFVLNGERWIPDPRNPDDIHDGHNDRNSVLRLGRIANLKLSPARVGDGAIDAQALEHDPRRPLYFQPLGPDRALVRYRTLADDVEQVTLVTPSGGPVNLTLVKKDPVFALWEAEAAWTPARPAADGGNAELDRAAEARYTFVLSDGATRVSDPQTYSANLAGADVFHTPDWAKHAIWYQIFPDRFRNGDPSNDRDPVRPWTSEWFTPSEWEGRDGQTFYKHFVFDRQYGGDLAGIEAQLPYLKELGVNALYLNPVFQSESNHKYNATNYVHIDEHFGTKGDYEAAAAKEDLNDPGTWTWTESDKKFLAFLDKAHQLGFRVIIDGVFNHVGTLHAAFQDVQKRGRSSPYADWFNITSWDPFTYEGWFGHAALPVFRKTATNLASQQVIDHIHNVTRRWMDPNGDGDPSDGIDGWRLDVPNEVPAPFWVEWRKLVKSINPDAYITGEIWDRAESWLDGRHFDAVMNYEFARAVVAWVFNKKQKITASDFDHRLRDLRLAYPLEATLVLQNLMNSHDTDRLASMARNPDRAYDHGNRIQDNGPNYDNGKPSPAEYRRARLAALIQMTYVGAPMVYYGDEVGMWGADDPTCRKPMLWTDLEPYEQPKENAVEREHLAFYRQIIALRNAHPALRTGAIQTVLADDQADVWAFIRKDDNEQVLVVLNSAEVPREVTVPLPPSAPNSWTGVYNFEGIVHPADGTDPLQRKLLLKVPAVGGIVLYAATPK